MDTEWLTSSEIENIREEIYKNIGNIDEFFRMYDTHRTTFLRIKNAQKYFKFIYLYGNERDKYQVIPRISDPEFIIWIYQTSENKKFRKLLKKSSPEIIYKLETDNSRGQKFINSILFNFEKVLENEILFYFLLFILLQVSSVFIATTFDIFIVFSVLIVIVSWLIIGGFIGYHLKEDNLHMDEKLTIALLFPGYILFIIIGVLDSHYLYLAVPLMIGFGYLTFQTYFHVESIITKNYSIDNLWIIAAILILFETSILVIATILVNRKN